MWHINCAGCFRATSAQKWVIELLDFQCVIELEQGWMFRWHPAGVAAGRVMFPVAGRVMFPVAGRVMFPVADRVLFTAAPRTATGCCELDVLSDRV